jgi:hypothetical protein
MKVSITRLKRYLHMWASKSTLFNYSECQLKGYGVYLLYFDSGCCWMLLVYFPVGTHIANRHVIAPVLPAATSRMHDRYIYHTVGICV